MSIDKTYDRSESMIFIPKIAWKRRFDATPPNDSTHFYSRPPILESLSLLPVAYRVGCYISNERANNREPIFDLAGITLKPPHPGPHAGVPLGGLGGGAIGRGFKGEFRRWSLFPGRYIHQPVPCDTFSIRVKRGNEIHSKVLSCQRPTADNNLSCWDWNLDESCATYYALYPFSWTVFKAPVPGIKVIIKQTSPFIPHNYSDASLPVSVFEVEVLNMEATECEVSIMFSFQNGFDAKDDNIGGFSHASFHVPSHELGSRNEDHDIDAPLTVDGVCLTHHTHNNKQKSSEPPKGVKDSSKEADSNSIVVDAKQGSYAIASLNVHSSSQVQSQSSQVIFVTEGSSNQSCQDVWNHFHQNGNLSHVNTPTSADDLNANKTSCKNGKVSKRGHKVAAAICSTKTVLPKKRSDFVFSLAWDHPIVEFGSGKQLPRYYTKFFGISGCSAPLIATYGLTNYKKWQYDISLWQYSTLQASTVDSKLYDKYFEAVLHLRPSERALSYSTYDDINHSHDDHYTSHQHELGHTADSAAHDHQTRYYCSQIFNELYFLVDGGTIWTDSENGIATNRKNNDSELSFENNLKDDTASHSTQTPVRINLSSSIIAQSIERSNNDNNDVNNNAYNEDDVNVRSPTKPSSVEITKQDSILDATSCCIRNTSIDNSINHENNSIATKIASEIIASVGITIDHLSTFICSTITSNNINNIKQLMRANDSNARNSNGNQSVVGQFLYLEGHEYYMYNTYDVHFYAGFSLLMLWPQLELSLQRDFAHAVHKSDPTTRRMMGTGNIRPKKVEGVVPHDLGSPSEEPWRIVNAYNFQDVSNWKDLGPKFVLQIYRDYYYLSKIRNGLNHDNSGIANGMTEFLREVYPIVIQVMKMTEKFDTDGDGMIENSGFPDQTYDIWTALGVHAYCGGLWISACEATSAMAAVMADNPKSLYYHNLANRARSVYEAKLWNGRYLDYDSSDSHHHNSIMADMLAGQWYARACELPPVISAKKALSCYKTIFEFNVIKFGDGKMLGAVNGMRPSGRIDNCSLQSREVWTGTTYGLSAGMLSEASANNAARMKIHLLAKQHQEEHLPTGANELLSASECEELVTMAYETSRGIHDAGWQEFGYWFATPEGWEKNGNYRSLGYMRPLSIWAMQYAQEEEKTRK
eukprot:gene12239-16403_t